MDRRRFLVRLETISAGALCASLPVLAGACARFQYTGTTRVGDRLVVAKAELGNARFALVDAPDLQMPIYLYRQEDQTYSAVLTRCMHRGCQVEPGAGHLVCPCHGSEYSNTGEVLKGPTELPLIRFDVTTDETNIYIRLTNEDV